MCVQTVTGQFAQAWGLNLKGQPEGTSHWPFSSFVPLEGRRHIRFVRFAVRVVLFQFIFLTVASIRFLGQWSVQDACSFNYYYPITRTPSVKNPPLRVPYASFVTAIGYFVAYVEVTCNKTCSLHRNEDIVSHSRQYTGLFGWSSVGHLNFEECPAARLVLWFMWDVPTAVNN